MIYYYVIYNALKQKEPRMKAHSIISKI